MRSPLARITRVRLPGDVHRTESAPPRWLLLSRRYGSRAIPVEHDLERRTVLGFRVAIKVFRSSGGNAGRTPSAAPRDARPAFVLVHGIGVSSRYFHPVARSSPSTGPCTRSTCRATASRRGSAGT